MTSEDGYSNWTSRTDQHHQQQDDDSALTQRQLLLDRFQAVAFKLLVPTIVTFGCVGNVINIVVLTRKSMKSSTNRYLTCLAVYDILYLVFAFSMILKHYDGVGALIRLFMRCIVLSHSRRTPGDISSPGRLPPQRKSQATY